MKFFLRLSLRMGRIRHRFGAHGAVYFFIVEYNLTFSSRRRRKHTGYKTVNVNITKLSDFSDFGS